eukprot:TRINITY_DN2355_c0_g1_i1.p1 TRINITY_DN2355_c0_g1~~TRINITY_DN2355_c0_g1_i1.p1  ORF type:complete len:214 (+),score=44.41 TRINITY_DN2355_c0_g1_i1:176-817(+)
MAFAAIFDTLQFPAPNINNQINPLVPTECILFKLKEKIPKTPSKAMPRSQSKSIKSQTKSKEKIHKSQSKASRSIKSQKNLLLVSLPENERRVAPPPMTPEIESDDLSEEATRPHGTPSQPSDASPQASPQTLPEPSTWEFVNELFRDIFSLKEDQADGPLDDNQGLDDPFGLFWELSNTFPLKEDLASGTLDDNQALGDLLGLEPIICDFSS